MTAEKTEKVVKDCVFAEEETTVHVALGDPDPNNIWPIESIIMLPGDFIDLSDLPTYLQDAVKAEKTPTLSLVTREEAEAKRADRERILSLLGSQVVNNTIRSE